jgi:hypothetical protein
MTFALPQDLLLAAHGASHDQVDCVAPLLRRSLEDRGFAETHLHLKAAIEFPTLWASLQRALAEESATGEMFAGPGAAFKEGRLLGDWLLRCALTRLVLAGFLANPAHRRDGLRSYLRGVALPGIEALAGPMAATMLYRALGELTTGQLLTTATPFLPLRQLYMSLIAPLAGGVPSPAGLQGQTAPAPDQESSLDPVAWWFPHGMNSSSEYGFMRAGIHYLEDQGGSEDSAFARLFWQVQRLRVFFYRHIVQRPMTPGLLWFTRTYARLSKPRSPLTTQTFVRGAVRLSGPGLKSLEVRLSPDPDKAKLVEDVQKFDAACREFPGIEAGIVFHLSRTRGDDAEKGHPQPWGKASHDDPEANPSGYRFARYYSGVKAEASALADMLRTYPRMLERVRGVDLCTDELGVPLWVVKPLLEHVLAAGRGAAEMLAATSQATAPPLHVTVHSGEDFVHLLGGIRRVGEAVEYLKLTEGDRIGHGVALGVDAADWAARSTGLAVPRGERLFDLLWTWRVAMEIDNGVLRSWLPWLTQEIPRLASDIFRQSYTVNELADWVTALHTGMGLFLSGFPNRPAPTPTTLTAQLIDNWLRNRGVFQRSQILEPVEVKREVELVSALQNYVLATLASRGVIVEINPSSNLLIGHLGDLTNHPLWRISPPSPDSGREQQVRVCIGSDDPITFATQLINDYQLLADAMLEGGLRPQDVDTWIERARSVGLDARFTVPRSTRPLTSLLVLGTSALLP